MNNQWTPERIEHLRHLWDVEGLSASLIADRLSCRSEGQYFSRNAIIGKVRRLGLAFRDAPISRRPTPKGAKRKKYVCSKPLPEQVIMPAIPVEPLPPEGQAPAKLFHLLDLENNQCRYCYGDPREPGPHFCGRDGANMTLGIAYCEEHRKLCSVGVPVRYRYEERTKAREKTYA
jgi:GcrA cell cycle regulator